LRSFKNIFFLICTALITLSCGTSKSVKSSQQPKPEWILNRPVDLGSYIGIGNASKTNNHLDYQQIAKKNALDDLVSEIKVTVSTNSVLKSVQNDLDFKQQFNSSTKVTALNTIEKFDVVGSWENANEFWIFYRLSKAEYEEMKRRKMQVQVDRALDVLQRADHLNTANNFIQKIHLKLQALKLLQDYLNEDVWANVSGKDVKLVDEIFTSVQDQLYNVKFKSDVSLMKGIVGKQLPSFNVTSNLSDGSIVSNLPLKAGSDEMNIKVCDRIETDSRGVALFANARVQGAGSTQFLRIAIDLEKIVAVDSLNGLLRSIVLTMNPSPLSIKVETQALKIFIDDEELNLSKGMEQKFVEPILRKQLTENGCHILDKKQDADYVVKIKSNTHDQGVMWGNMLSSGMDVSLSLIDNKTNVEVYKDGIQNVKGFQTTHENAGLDAYKKGMTEAEKKLIPSFVNAVLSGGN